jgi:pilus assembly protein CpaB
MAKETKAADSAASTGVRALVFLVLALVAGAAATIMVFQLIQSYKARIADAQKPEETEMVIVAAGDLFPGVTIAESDIVGVQVPKKYVPDDAFTSPELVVGRIPRERILANEFIRPQRLADGEAGVGLNALVPPGMRALSLNVSEGAAVSGFLEPGNRVDLLVTIHDEDGGPSETLTFLQTVPILAVNSRMLKEGDTVLDPNTPEGKEQLEQQQKQQAQRRASPSVTLAVTPEQAETVAHASRQGVIRLTLRSDIDTEIATTDVITTSDLFPAEPPPPPPTEPTKAKVRKPPPPPPPVDHSVTIIKGSTSTERKVP